MKRSQTGGASPASPVMPPHLFSRTALSEARTMTRFLSTAVRDRLGKAPACTQRVH